VALKAQLTLHFSKLEPATLNLVRKAALQAMCD
jgi:hypothetical protein